MTPPPGNSYVTWIVAAAVLIVGVPLIVMFGLAVVTVAFAIVNWVVTTPIILIARLFGLGP